MGSLHQSRPKTNNVVARQRSNPNAHFQLANQLPHQPQHFKGTLSKLPLFPPLTSTCAYNIQLRLQFELAQDKA